MKQYLLSMIHPGTQPPPPEVLGPVMAQLGEIRAELEASGRWVFGNGLHNPDTATVVRCVDGQDLVTDGPFVETKEFLGGVTIIQAADLDEALALAKRYARATTLPIEVRPFVGEVDD